MKKFNKFGFIGLVWPLIIFPALFMAVQCLFADEIDEAEEMLKIEMEDFRSEIKAIQKIPVTVRKKQKKKALPPKPQEVVVRKPQLPVEPKEKAWEIVEPGKETARVSPQVDRVWIEPPEITAQSRQESEKTARLLEERDARIARLMADREEKKITGLAEANQEISRLRDLARRIGEANKREKVTMYYNIGCVYRATRQYRKAEAKFLNALELDPYDADVHYNLAILYDDDLNEKEKARKHYEKFLELAPNDKDAAKVQEWLASLM